MQPRRHTIWPCLVLLALARGASLAQQPEPKPLEAEIGASFVFIPAGAFEMGCSDGDKECDRDEKPRHPVRVTKPFRMMKTEVTFAWFRDWAAAAGYEPPAKPDWTPDNGPVVNVTWNDARAFCSAFRGRLPTEAEWEYAARAGSTASRYAALGYIGWYDRNSNQHAHSVGEKIPNGFGLYDMIGNVAEWTLDWFDEKYYDQKVENDPPGPAAGQKRVIRGGSWVFDRQAARASMRVGLDPAKATQLVGFRCVRDADSDLIVPSSPDLKRVQAGSGPPGP